MAPASRGCETARGDQTGHVMMHLDLNLTGESRTVPHLRGAPFRKDKIAQLISAALRARRSKAEAGAKLIQGDVFAYTGGARKGR